MCDLAPFLCTHNHLTKTGIIGHNHHYIHQHLLKIFNNKKISILSLMAVGTCSKVKKKIEFDGGTLGEMVGGYCAISLNTTWLSYVL